MTITVGSDTYGIWENICETAYIIKNIIYCRTAIFLQKTSNLVVRLYFLANLLGLDVEKNLDPALPQTLVENIVEYMSHYKQINDYIEIKSGKVYDLGIGVDLFIDKNYDTANVVSNDKHRVRLLRC